MLPAVAGVEAVTVNEAAVLLLVKALESPATHLRVPPEADGNEPQSADTTPAPTATLVATTPAGNTSATVAVNPDGLVPLLVILKV